MNLLATTMHDWYVTNDSVMGGVSKGSVSLKNNTCIFAGVISTDNNGGFTSAFIKLTSSLTNEKQIAVRILGDGNTYQLRVKANVTGYELAYKVTFETLPNTIETHYFALSEFIANFRGRPLTTAPTLTAESISHVGFLLRDYEPKTFKLHIYSISFS